jgi:putative ABC transport system permease protein
MFKHNFIIALRNIIKYWKYSLINVGGLAIGLASFIFIALYIEDELKFDGFNEKADRIYRVNRLYNANDVLEDASTLSFPEGPAMEFQYPGLIEKQVRFFNSLRTQWFFDYTNEKNEVIRFNEKWFFLADSTVFDIFTYNFIEGDKKNALNRPNCIVLSSSTSKRYFGDASPMGKSLRVEEGLNFEVTGVFEDLPAQSHMKIDLLGSLNTFRQFGNGQYPTNWIWNPCWTYVLLREGVTPEMLNAKFPEFYRNNYFDFKDQDVKLYLQALTDIHLKSKHVYEMRPNSNVIYVYILSIVAIIILVLACINFMNLATASSAGRAKEIGIKKVFGVMKFQLTLQFLGEAILQSFFAIIFALLFFELLLPSFNNFTEKTISFETLVEPIRILTLLGLVIIVGLLAGTYPAFFLSSFKPLRVLRGTLKSGAKSIIARKVLVIGQFTISISLIIGTLVVFAQLNFIRRTDLGFKKDQVIIFRRVGNLGQNYEAFKQELLKYKDISHVTGSEDILGVFHNTRPYEIEGLVAGQNYWIPAFLVDWDFVQTFDIEVVAGRAFSRDFQSDTINAVMINETMARDMGWSNEGALGKRVKSTGSNERVIGVFKDFYAMSLHHPVNNFVLDMFRRPADPNLIQIISVRVNTENYKDVLKYIESKWNEFNPTRPFDYQFLDSEINGLYKDDIKFGKFSIMLTVLAILIASMGLIGLTSFLAEQRTREIGIRKVLGASSWSIVRLMFSEFIILLIIANLIAWPVTYFITTNWLNNYAKHISTDWGLYVLAGLITIVLALVITGYWALRTSSLNPAKTLKYE